MRKLSYGIIGLTTAAIVAGAPCYNVLAMSQDETVYAKLQNTGAVKHIAVTKHLINNEKSAELTDRTLLKDLENLNGEESFTLENEKVVWRADGKDIYYRGTASQDLPVQLEVKYFLDGAEKSLDEILGKSGKVELRLHYRNLSKVGDLYTPLVAAVATTLDESKVSDVKVSNGKATSNGRTIAIAAVATPGLYESLGIEELKHSDTVVISYETEKFELGDIYTVVTPKLIDSADLKTFTELNKLYSSANTLAASSKQLVSGAEQLANGATKLQSSVNGMVQKLEVPTIMLGEAQLNEIKAQAKAAAEQQVEAQRTNITATIKNQLANNAALGNALKLQATEMCQKDLGAQCTNTAIQQYATKLSAGVEAELVESSMNLAKMTAGQTAAQTAETVAVNVVSTIQKTLAPMLKQSMTALTAGVNQLATGANELKAGMIKFDHEGITPLNNLINGKVKVTANKMERLVKLADEYNNYSGISENVKGETKFIMMIEGRK